MGPEEVEPVSGPTDIRDADRDRYWEEFETRWTGLLSYRYLGRSHVGFDRQADPSRRDTMRLRFDMRNRTGGVMAAPLCIASPEAGGFSDLNAIDQRSTFHQNHSQISLNTRNLQCGIAIQFARVSLRGGWTLPLLVCVVSECVCTFQWRRRLTSTAAPATTFARLVPLRFAHQNVRN